MKKGQGNQSKKADKDHESIQSSSTSTIKSALYEPRILIKEHLSERPKLMKPLFFVIISILNHGVCYKFSKEQPQ